MQVQSSTDIKAQAGFMLSMAYQEMEAADELCSKLLDVLNGGYSRAVAWTALSAVVSGFARDYAENTKGGTVENGVALMTELVSYYSQEPEAEELQ